MAAVPDAIRLRVERRAGRRCEYCRLPIEGQVAPFQVDHIVPRSRDGATELENLAFACPWCNGRKWAHVDAVDPESGETVALFNPRLDNWTEHFRWSSHDRLILLGITPSGRATIERLQLNHPDMVHLREFLDGLGVEVS